MPRQIILRPPSLNRRQPLLAERSPSGSVRFAEVAGETTAECAAICCCCPCGLVNLLLLAVYKLPAGLCRRALRKRKRRSKLKNPGLFAQRRTCKCGCDDTELQIHPMSLGMLPEEESDQENTVEALSEKEVLELEKEMWDRFYSTGFWRSPSQRE